MSDLARKWGSKRGWFRTLHARTELLWIFRVVLIERHQLKWLRFVLEAVSRATAAMGPEASSKQEAFDGAVKSTLDEIDPHLQHRGTSVESKKELSRLRALVVNARPVDPLQQMFDGLNKKALDVYRRSACRKTTLAYEWWNEHPSGPPRPHIGYSDPYHVNAQTSVRGEIATVELQIHLDGFDILSLLVVPTLLTHELVCHAHAREDRDNNASPWAEGFMDWVAKYFLDYWMMDLDLPPIVAIREGNELCRLRDTYTRETGHYAADAVANWLAKTMSDRIAAGTRRDIGRAEAAKLGLQLNSLNSPLDKKDGLTARLLRIEGDPDLQNAVLEWRAGAPVSRLLL